MLLTDSDCLYLQSANSPPRPTKLFAENSKSEHKIRTGVFILTLATKIVDPSRPACRLLMISGGMFGLLRIEGGRFIRPGVISGPCPPENGPLLRCSALRACSPSGSYNTFDETPTSDPAGQLVETQKPEEKERSSAVGGGGFKIHKTPKLAVSVLISSSRRNKYFIVHGGLAPSPLEVVLSDEG